MLRNMAGIYIMYHHKILMLYRIGSRALNKSQWVGAAGGHMEPNELNDPKHCAIRELFEETGMDESCLQNLKLKYVTIRKMQDEIRLNYYFFADLVREPDEELQSNEGKLEWVDFSEVLEKDMPYTAHCCLSHYLKTGHNDNDVYGVLVHSSQDSIQCDIDKLS